MKIVIEGRIPSKKNSKRIIYSKNRPILISSKAYLDWQQEWMWRLKKFVILKGTEPVKMRIEFFAPDKRDTDLTNKAESIMDLLVDVGIISDDNWKVVTEVTLVYLGVDKVRPRAHVEILPVR